MDVSTLLDAVTNFTGTTAAQAISQGYLYFVQTGPLGGTDSTTTVYIDRNGIAFNNPLMGDIAVVLLLGVDPSEPGTGQFIV